jgi:hypothetical protein
MIALLFVAGDTRMAAQQPAQAISSAIRPHQDAESDPAGALRDAWDPARVTRDSRAEAISSPRITVRLYNYARVSSSSLSEAVAYAEEALRRAGLRAEWIEHSITASGCVSVRGSDRLGPSDLVLRILADRRARRLHPKSLVLGMAHMESGKDYGMVASIFSGRITSIAEAAGFRDRPLLGHVLAHEVGHLLLGPGRHAKAGLMRCPWGKRELKKAARGQLWFRAEEARRIRDRAWARTPSQRPQFAEQQGAGGAANESDALRAHEIREETPAKGT